MLEFIRATTPVARNGKAQATTQRTHALEHVQEGRFTNREIGIFTWDGLELFDMQAEVDKHFYSATPPLVIFQKEY